MRETPNIVPLFDAEMIRQAQRGETFTFQEIAKRYSTDLFKLAYSMIGNADDAEDILQETFIGAYRGIKKFKGFSSLKTWLIRILFNQIAKKRREQSRSCVTSIEDIHDLHNSEMGKDNVKQRTSILKMDLAVILESLPPEEREVIVLREMQGMSYAEISEALDVPIGTVESRLFRARQELREKCRDYMKI